MRFFRWILSNIIMIIIVVGLIYSYVYWGNLAGSDTPAGKAIVYLSDEFVSVKEFVDAIKTKNKDKGQQTEQQGKQKDVRVPAGSEAAASVHADNTNVSVAAALDNRTSVNPVIASTPSADTVAAFPAATDNDNDASHEMAAADKSDVQVGSSTIENAEKWQPEQPPVTISYSHNKTQIQQDSNGDVHELVSHSGTAPAAAVTEIVQVDTQKDGFVSPAIEKELETATAEGSVAALTPDATRTVWINARKAFYQRDFVESEKRYQRVISMTKDNYDAYGELGNVYFHQGKNSEAADAYMAASEILIRQGNVDRAKSLLGLMRYLDKDKALLLQKRLAQKK